eukprot:2854779-Lingulodinium_polyedra.AAC.1
MADLARDADQDLQDAGEEVRAAQAETADLRAARWRGDEEPQAALERGRRLDARRADLTVLRRRAPRPRRRALQPAMSQP